MEVIIVGAGASGLMAAYELSRKGIEVLMLDSENRIGGRIHTHIPDGFVHEIEAGAEFVHGNLLLTLRLLKKAGLTYTKTGGRMYQSLNGKIEQRSGQGKSWDLFYEKLENTRQNITLELFVTRHFPGDEFAKLRKEVFEMAQGLDLADPSKLSVLGIRQEWLSEEPQYRIDAGYHKLLEFLLDSASGKGMQLHLNQTVNEIHWNKGKVTVSTQNANYTADAVLLTVSVPNYQKGKINFKPEVPVLENFKSIGFGEVIKLLLEFNDAFWEAEYPDLGFLFTEDGFTFWTQLLQHKPFLVGWIGNGYANDYRNVTDKKLLDAALKKLRSVFPEATEKYHAGSVFRYTENSISGGGYSWLMPQSKKAIEEINKGIGNVIWFAGEALHPGGEPGTVEAALQSGKNTARKILKF